MLRSILAALDSDEGGHAVIELAVRWAKECGARLTGIGVVDHPATRPPVRIREPDLELAWMEGHWKDERERVERRMRVSFAFKGVVELAPNVQTFPDDAEILAGAIPKAVWLCPHSNGQ